MRFFVGGGAVLFALGAACGGSTDSTDPVPNASTSSSGSTGSSSGTGTTHPPSYGMPPPPQKKPTPEAHDNYRAWSQPSGTDLFVARSDPKSDTCIRIHLVTPWTAPAPLYAKMKLPQGWSVRDVTIEPGAAACLLPETQPGVGEEAGTAAGTIGATWRVAGGIVPCTLDVEAKFGFSKVGTVDMYVLGLKVDDCTM